MNSRSAFCIPQSAIRIPQWGTLFLTSLLIACAVPAPEPVSATISAVSLTANVDEFWSDTPHPAPLLRPKKVDPTSTPVPLAAYLNQPQRDAYFKQQEREQLAKAEEKSRIWDWLQYLNWASWVVGRPF